jgi:hypothetical protein
VSETARPIRRITSSNFGPVMSPAGTRPMYGKTSASSRPITLSP